jgi:hypothetical protein
VRAGWSICAVFPNSIGHQQQVFFFLLSFFLEWNKSASSRTTCFFRIHTTPIDDFFIYLFYRDFAKIYGPAQTLQKYRSAVVTHGVSDITPWEPPGVGP